MNKPLLCVAGVLVVVTPYAVLRLQPLLRQRSHAARELKEGQEELEGNPAPATPTEQLARDVGSLESRHAALREELTAREGRLAKGADASALSLQLSRLAAEVGLQIQSREKLAGQAARVSRRMSDDEEEPPGRPAPPPPPRGDPSPWNLQDFLRAAPHARSIERWDARGSFTALRAFLSRLDELGGPIVLRVQVLRDEGEGEASPPLLVKLTVAL